MSERKHELNRQDTPPPVVRVTRLEVIGAGKPVRVLCCSPSIWGFRTHWDPEQWKTIPCTKPEKLCFGHTKKLASRWKGILTVRFEFATEAKLLDIPPETGKKLGDDIAGGTLRGKILLCYRESKNPRSRLIIEIVGETPQPETLLPDIDPTPTLKKIWGMI